MLTALLVFPVLLTMFLLAMERLESALLDDVDGDAATPVEGRAADDAERPVRPARRAQDPPTAGRRPLRRVGPDRPGRRLPGRSTDGSTDESADQWRESA